MRVTKLVLACLMVFGFIAGVALAQEGHPLKGSWLGDYGVTKTARTQVFLTMDWDGKAISGMINPGTDNIPFKIATLTPPTPAPGGGGRGGGRGGGGGAGQGGGQGGRGGGGGGQGGGGAAQAGTPPAAAAPAAAAPAAPAPPPVPAAPAAPPQPDWLLHIEADGKDRAGAVVKYVIDGKVENIGLTNRSIVGSWTVGTTKNDFRLVRQ
jgi:hypothetical protein